MISIDRVYKTVLTIANSDVRGNVRPDEIRLIINNVVNEIIDSYFFEVNRAINRENRGLLNGGLENIPDRIRENIQHFLKEENLVYQAPYFLLPDDYRHIDSVYYNDTELEPCKNRQEFKAIVNFIDTKPTTSYPIFLKTEDKIQVAPDTITDNVTMWYLRKHKIANWTFVVLGENEVFNPSAPDFQDIDLHPSEEANVVLKTLIAVGVNVKEQDLQALQQTQAMKFNEENQS